MLKTLSSLLVIMGIVSLILITAIVYIRPDSVSIAGFLFSYLDGDSIDEQPDDAEQTHENGLRGNPGLFVRPVELNFGDLRGNVSEIYTKSLEIQNRSTADITISAINASCGCTVADVELPFTIGAHRSVSFPVRLVVDGSYDPGAIRREL